jgi:hypothetical protein
MAAAPRNASIHSILSGFAQAITPHLPKRDSLDSVRHAMNKAATFDGALVESDRSRLTGWR